MAVGVVALEAASAEVEAGAGAVVVALPTDRSRAAAPVQGRWPGRLQLEPLEEQ